MNHLMKLNPHEQCLLLHSYYNRKAYCGGNTHRLANFSKDFRDAFTSLYEAGLVCRWWCTITPSGFTVAEGLLNEQTSRTSSCRSP